MNFVFPKEKLVFDFHFRKQLADKVTKLPGKDYEEIVEDGKKYLKRKTEQFVWECVPKEIDLSPELIESFLAGLVQDNLKGYIDKGLVPAQTDINLKSIIDDYLSGPSDARKYSKEFRAEVADHFAEYLRSLGRAEAGIIVQRDLLAGGVNANSANKYFEGLPKIKENFEEYIANQDEETQEKYAEFMLSMITKVENILNPSETINIEDLGL